MRKLNLVLPVISEEEARHAFDRVRPAFDDLRDDQLVAINLDLARAAGIVLTAEPKVRALRDDIEKHTPGFDTNLIDSLHDIALAAWYVHTVMSPPAIDGVPRKLLNEALRLRRTLLIQARALRDRGLIHVDKIPFAGRRNAELGDDLLRLAEVYRSAWDSISHRTLVTREEIERALALGNELKSTHRHPEIDVATLRVRAFSLLARTYDQVRRVVTYIRWNENDADNFAPSIYTGSRGGRRNGSE